MVAVLWLLGGVILIAAEVISGDFVLVMLGAAALGAAGASALGVGLGFDALVFAALAFGLIFFARPALKRHVHSGYELKTNVDALVGAKAIVESTVNARDGRVRIGGDVWSARAFDETQVMEAGQTVTVMEVAGATALVCAEPWGG